MFFIFINIFFLLVFVKFYLLRALLLPGDLEETAPRDRFLLPAEREELLTLDRELDLVVGALIMDWLELLLCVGFSSMFRERVFVIGTVFVRISEDASAGDESPSFGSLTLLLFDGARLLSGISVAIGIEFSVEGNLALLLVYVDEGSFCATELRLLADDTLGEFRIEPTVTFSCACCAVVFIRYSGPRLSRLRETCSGIGIPPVFSRPRRLGIRSVIEYDLSISTA